MKTGFDKVKNIILLQAVVVIYTLTSIVGKKASGAEIMSFEFILYYGLDVFILGIYAICWQQMIKKFDLSVAYANRAMAILWTGLWAVVIFRESLSAKQIVGIVVVMLGTVIVNIDRKASGEGGEHHD